MGLDVFSIICVCLCVHVCRSGNEEKLMALLTPLNVNCHASDGRKVRGKSAHEKNINKQTQESETICCLAAVGAPLYLMSRALSSRRWQPRLAVGVNRWSLKPLQ